MQFQKPLHATVSNRAADDSDGVDPKHIIATRGANAAFQPVAFPGTGWNVGIRAAAGNYLLRIDAVHCRLQPNYVHCCLEKLLELQHGGPRVAATGGRRLSVDRAETAWSKAIAAAHSLRGGRRRLSDGYGSGLQRYSGSSAV